MNSTNNSTISPHPPRSRWGGGSTTSQREGVRGAIVQGTELETLPSDLYVPPDALQVFLEGFEGPLDLLLYLIQHQNLDILNIPIAEVTRQYLQYVDIMRELDLDLAAEYLAMAAMLMEIKSRLLLPTANESTDSEDPRTKLVQQLREYAQYKQAAQDLDKLPRLERDILPVSIELPEIPKEIKLPQITWTALLEAMRDVMERASLFTSHHIISEPLSVRERMTLILERLTESKTINFIDCFTLEEGRSGVVVTLLALLELSKESLIQIVQPQPYKMIQVISS